MMTNNSARDAQIFLFALSIIQLHSMAVPACSYQLNHFTRFKFIVLKQSIYAIYFNHL